MVEGKLFNGSQSPSAIALDPKVSALRQALGTVICAALDDHDVVEVLLNIDGRLWVERVSSGREPLDMMLTPGEGERIIRALGTQLGVEVNRGQPLLSAVLPGTGDRFEGALPPVAPGPAFALRKRAAGVAALEGYVDGGIMTTAQAEYLRLAVQKRQNILIAGGSGVGKTTLANTLLAEMAATAENVLVLEDKAELQCTTNHQVPLRTSPELASMSELVCAAERLRPDRFVLGEVQGAEALEVLNLWNKSRPGGLTTIQAGSMQGALLRLEHLISPEPEETARALIADTIQVVVYLAGRGDERRVACLARVTGFDGAGYWLVEVD